MDLYIIRHGDPDYAHDTLTEKGWEQAKLLAPRIAEINPDYIYVSPLQRAQHTAQPSCELLHKEFIVQEWMREDMDYMRKTDLTNPDIRDCGYRVSWGGGVILENDYLPQRTEFLMRMQRASDAFLASHGYVREGFRYKAVHPNNDQICCFCHGGFGGAWVGYLLGISSAFAWYSLDLKTSSVTHFIFEPWDDLGYCTARAEYIGDRSHLNGTQLFLY